MNPNAQREAQRRADQIAAFRRELVALEKAQVLTLTADQQERLNAHLDAEVAALRQQFGADTNEAARRISWGMRVVTFLGACAFAAAIVLFLHRVWGGLPSVAQVMILAAVPLGLLGVTEFARCREAPGYYTALLACAAAAGLAFGLDALGGTFNLTPSPHALLAWAAFAILVACAYGLRLLLGLGLGVGCAYVAALWLDVQGGFWGDFMQHPAGLIPAAAVVYFFPGLLRRADPQEFGTVFRTCGGAVGMIALLMLSEEGHWCWLPLPRQRIEVLCQLAGLFVGLGIVRHGLRIKRTGLVNLGAAGFVVFLYVRLHDWWWDWMPKYLFFLLLGAIALLLWLVFRRMRLRASDLTVV